MYMDKLYMHKIYLTVPKSYRKRPHCKTYDRYFGIFSECICYMWEKKFGYVLLNFITAYATFCTSVWNLVSWGKRKQKINHYVYAETKFLQILFSNTYQLQSAHPNSSQISVQSSSNALFCFRQIHERTTNYNTTKILLV